jgi:hypothetical protein
MHPIRHAALAVWSLVLLLHASACTPQPVNAPRAVWPAQLDYCVIGDSPEEAYEIGALVLEALDAWRVGATVETGTYHNPPQQIDCVPVLLVDGYTQDGRVGETAYTARGPARVTFARWWWTVCPAGRRAIVAHEIGHSVGHIGHGQEGGAIGVAVDCSGEAADPTPEEVWHAWRIRTQGIR